MKRHLCATALLALALIPDWASACWRWGGPVAEPVYYAPAYRAPVYHPPIYHAPVYHPYPAPQPVYVVPAASPAAQPPRIEPLRKNGVQIEPARPIAQPTPAPKPPQSDPVRPAAGVEVPKAPQPAPRVEVPTPPAAKPEPAPAPAPEPKRGGLIEIPRPAPEPKLPPIEAPKIVPEPKLPPLELPKDAGPKLPSLDPPGGSAPAVPAPAPPPTDVLIPAPALPTPTGPGALPPLTLPPDTPVAPEKPVEVKSSPLTGTAREPKVSVFPATGAAAAAPGLRKVGFYNHTARDLSLTIEGKAVTLPAMSYIHAQVPPAFTWKYGDKPALKETVPAGAAGVDVLIRE